MLKNGKKIPVKKEVNERKGKEIYFCSNMNKLLQMGARYMLAYGDILFWFCTC
jgi:hypothetical protein